MAMIGPLSSLAERARMRTAGSMVSPLAGMATASVATLFS